MISKGKKLPAVVYIRMSTPTQTESPERQRMEAKKIARNNNLKILREYHDPGITGHSLKQRPQFEKMLFDQEHKQDFVAIICFDQARFGRWAPAVAGKIVEPLAQAGILLVTKRKTLDFSVPDDQATFMNETKKNHDYCVDTAANIVSGKGNAAIEGRPGARPPFGYDRLYRPKGLPEFRVPFGRKYCKPKGFEGDVKFVKNDDAKTVKRIFRMYVDGHSVVSIAAVLNREGILSPSGKTWGGKVIARILENRRYTGANVAGEYSQAKFSGIHGEVKPDESKRGTAEFGAVDGRAKQKKTGAPIIVPGKHDRIISDKLFEQAQAITRVAPKVKTRRRNNCYLLADRLFCGNCGAKMHGGGSGGSDPHRNKRYRCSAATNGGGCEGYFTVPKDPLETFILSKIEEQLTSPSALKAIRQEMLEMARDNKQVIDRRRQLEKQREALAGRVSISRENWSLESDPDDKAILKEQFHHFRDQLKELDDEIETLDDAPDSVSPEERAQEAVRLCKNFCRKAKSMDPEDVRAVFQNVLKRVTVNFDPSRKRGSRFISGTIEFDPMFVAPGYMEKATNKGDKKPYWGTWSAIYLDCLATVSFEAVEVFGSAADETVSSRDKLAAVLANLNGPTSIKTIAEESGLSTRACWYYIGELVEAGELVRPDRSTVMKKRRR